MLCIDDQLSHIQHARQQHAKYITCYIKRKVYGRTIHSVCGDIKCIICRSRTRKTPVSRYLRSIIDQLDIAALAGSGPAELFRIQRSFSRLYLRSRNRISDPDHKSILNIFNYDWFEDKGNHLYNAYHLCANLKIESCIYSNRLYTSTVINDRGQSIIRPTLDHWFPQSKYPLLLLSFYNLIPSCSSCNSSVKHASTFSLRTHIHPYLDKQITKAYKIESVYKTSINEYKINIKTSDSRIASTLKAMQIADIYEHHQSELADLDLLKRKYNESYLETLGKLLDARLTKKDVYRLMFGVEYEDENFYKRPLSKLKKDILNLRLK